MSEITDILDRKKRLKSSRSVWENHWQDLAEVMLPKRADFTVTRTAGEKRTEKQFDGVPMQAARGLASAIDAMIKPKTQRWFSVKAEDEALNEDGEVKGWLRAAEDLLFDAFYEPASRFLQRTAEVDLDLVVFGTACLFVGERENGRGLLFSSCPLNGTYIAENAEGTVDTAYRCQNFTARQAAQKFGDDNIGRLTREAIERGKDPDRTFEFVQVIQPRKERDRSRRDSRNLPFSSVVIDVESEHKVGESGFHEFPLVVPRWDTATGEVYGRSPGMLALPDVNTLHQMGKTILEAGHKAVNPPWLVPNDGIASSPRTFPGGITPYDASLLQLTGGRPPMTPLISGADIPLGREMQNDIREQVWSAFFRNVLQLPFAGPQMTATEILERKAEFMRVIGPTFGRLEADYTGPMVERGFMVLLRAGAFPDPPEALQGRGIKFEYASPIAKAQRQIDAAAMAKTAEDIAPLIQLNPALMDNFDDDKITREISEANGLPQDWLRPVEARDQLRQQRAQAQQAEAQMQAVERLAPVAKDGAAALKAVTEQA